ncbi:adenylate/guanylate cyclase domain-containing protein [Mycobacterium sp. NPDC051804]|uniref:adenylate/guanylate cyclase domain-containing protein n=1 Tax=Mycobacterium sp. NPDC051804 TaxID=3364295 RepID=UPI0037B9D1BD
MTKATDRCRTCGNELRVEARFCDECGAPVSAPIPTGERKQVTVLFIDVVGSMKLAAALDPERLQEIMNELFNRAAAVVQRYQGMVDKFTGDGLMALFGAPVALEDHALRACIAALEIQAVTKSLAEEVGRQDGRDLQIRVGLNSGEVIAGEIGAGPGRYTAVGHPVGMAQRMESAAPAGGVLCSQSTADLVEGSALLGQLEDVVVKGANKPVAARQLISVQSGKRVVGRNEGVMLGRDAEMNWLRNIFGSKQGGLIAIIGDPGLGKSRLVAEFTAITAREGADVVIARCEAHTATLAFRSLSRMLRAMFGVEELSDADAREFTAAQYNGLLPAHSPDAQILFEAMGIAESGAELQQVSIDGRRRRLVEMMAQAVLARSTRTVFVLEDAHWIDAPSDEVLCEFAATLTVTTSTLVTTYRPEFHGALHQNSRHSITLSPLVGSTAVSFVEQILGNDPALKSLADRIAVAALGNPFFAEEIVRDMAGSGVLNGSRGDYRLTRAVDEIAVPATVQAVLAARIDRLPTEAKSILNAAAVIGTRFDVETLHTLLPNVAPTRLADLVSAELIDQTEFVPRQRYCFRHPLVRTVSYESQLITTRAQAHRRLAAAIKARDPAAADENAELIATHYEAAGDVAEAYCWHMRAAEWLASRDLRSACSRWESAQRIADQMPDDHDDVAAMRIATRMMLISKSVFVGHDIDADEQFNEFREMTTLTGDMMSLAIGMAGRVISLTANDIRVPEAAQLAEELAVLADRIDCNAETLGVILFAVTFARFANCDFAAALNMAERITALLEHLPTMELALAGSVRGGAESFTGDHENGRKHMRESYENTQGLPPSSQAIVWAYWGVLATVGIYKPSEIVDDMRRNLTRAESFGDLFCIIAAQWSTGVVLLRTDDPARDEAIELLERARESIYKNHLFTAALPAIVADLSIEAACKGRRDEAIIELRNTFVLHVTRGWRFVAGRAGEALVELLIERSGSGDLAEAHQIVDNPLARHPDIPAMDLWWLRSRALLAEAESDDSHAELTRQYLALCEKLNARGRLAEARHMADRLG